MNDMFKYDCVIFDFDGTLINTLPDAATAVNYSLKKHGYPEVTEATVRDREGFPPYNFFVDCMPNGCTDAEKDEAFKDFTEYYKAHTLVLTKPYDGICEMLQKLKSLGIKTAVISNKVDSQVKELTDIFFKDILGFTIGVRDGVAPKPATDMYELTKKELGVNSPLYVGDCEFDTMFANIIGCDCVSVTWGYRDKDVLLKEKPAYLVETVDELFNLIIKNTKGNNLYEI